MTETSRLCWSRMQEFQGYEPIMVLFHLVFDGEKPQCEFQYTDLTIRTRYNLPPV